jgi:FSR family fosmidomycin resistance protein-like MFS transporter
MGLTHSFGIVAVLVILGAVGTGIFHPEGVVSLHQAAGRQAHFLVPFFMACGFFFSAAAAPVSIYWVENLGFPSLYWLALPGLVLALLLFLHRRRDRRDHPGTAHQRHSQRRVGVSSAQPSFWPLLATAGALNIATALFMALLTSHYEIHFGSASHRTAGWMLLLMGGLASLVSFFWGHLTRQDRFRRFYLLVLASQLLATPLFFWLPHAATPTTGLVICIALSLIAPGAIYPVSVTLSRDTSGLTHSLRAALMIGGTWGTAALVVTLSGILLEAGVDTRQLLSGSAFFTLVAALIALWQVLARGWGKGAEEIGSAGRE